MNWIDILKNVITQGRVKEIEDIDIDIEDDDCLRWLEKLYNIILRHPESQVLFDEITDEEDACKVKALWEEDKINFEFEDKNTESSMEYYRKNKRVRTSNPHMHRRTYNVDSRTGIVRLELFNNPSDYGDTLAISLDSAIGDFDKASDTIYSYIQKTVYFSSKNRKKVSKVLKEICNYVNISYDKMTEGLL